MSPPLRTGLATLLLGLLTVLLVVGFLEVAL